MGDLIGGAVSSLIGGGLGLLGATDTNQTNAQNVQDTNAANAQIAAANNAWSAQQFATRYQTTVKDLTAAGLNPMLAYTQGGGSPPTAQPVTMQPYAKSNALQAASQGALNASGQLATIQLQKEQAQAASAQTEVNRT